MAIDEVSCDASGRAHRYDFFRNWLDDPFHVASIAPSGRMLARRMALGLDPGDTVIELGAGTGTLTRAIRAAGVQDGNLHLVERNRNFAAILAGEFPAASTHCTEAHLIESAIPDLAGTVDCVISGLPILWFEREAKIAILEAVFGMLRPGGFLQQFTYLGKPPVSASIRNQLGLDARLIALAPLNLPPAFVYRFTRR